MMIPKSPNLQHGIILEFKACKTESELEEAAAKALTQIQDQKYIQAFPKDTPVLLIGMAFCGKEMKEAHTLLEARVSL